MADSVNIIDGIQGAKEWISCKSSVADEPCLIPKSNNSVSKCKEGQTKIRVERV